MNILHRLFRRGRQAGTGAHEPTGLPEDAQIRERMHAEWEDDYRRRARRFYELERRTNWLSERLFPPSPEEGGNSHARH